MRTIYLVPLVDLDTDSYKIAKQICLEHGGCYAAAPTGTRQGNFRFPASYAFASGKIAIDCEAAIARAFLDIVQ